jgi:hypothetical protein
MDGRDKDDGRSLEARMLANDVGQFEAIKLRHAHVQQHDRNVCLQQMVEGFSSRTRFDQILAQFLEYDLITEQLGGLIIDHKYVDLLLLIHDR